MVELEHWLMWWERCAAARCTPAAQYYLVGFAFDRFRRYLQKLGPTFSPPAAPDAWHAFETHLALGRTRPLKAWKSWLFARGGQNPTLDCIQGGATLIMRDVVRAYLRDEHSPPGVLSLDVPLDGAADQSDRTARLEDLLPSTDDPLATLDAPHLKSLVDQIFPDLTETLSFREQVALVVYHRDKALSHPAVTAAADCGKSTLCTDLHRGIQKMTLLLQERLSGESPSMRMEVARRLIEKNMAKIEEKLEMAHPDLFMLIKEGSDNGS